jgi:hypothetical protein
MLAQNLPVTQVGNTGLRIGTAPGSATVEYLPTPGAAQQAQISGQVQGAEVIGAALLYPNQAPDAQLAQVEGCLSGGVQG